MLLHDAYPEHHAAKQHAQVMVITVMSFADHIQKGKKMHCFAGYMVD
jgi:hypothetical protein